MFQHIELRPHHILFHRAKQREWDRTSKSPLQCIPSVSESVSNAASHTSKTKTPKCVSIMCGGGSLEISTDSIGSSNLSKVNPNPRLTRMFCRTSFHCALICAHVGTWKLNLYFSWNSLRWMQITCILLQMNKNGDNRNNSVSHPFAFMFFFGYAVGSFACYDCVIFFIYVHFSSCWKIHLQLKRPINLLAAVKLQTFREIRFKDFRKHTDTNRNSVSCKTPLMTWVLNWRQSTNISQL